jgi:hypothetical protein
MQIRGDGEEPPDPEAAKARILLTVFNRWRPLQEESAEDERRRKRKYVLLATGGIVVVAVVVALAFIYVPGKPAPGQNSTTTKPAEDPDRYQNVQEKRTVDLVPQERHNWVDIEYWRHDAAVSGELQMDATGVHTATGAQLAVIADTPLAGRARCAQVTSWRDRVEFSELHAGSQLCGRSRAGRYASLLVQSLPTPSDGRFFFYGITWN